MGLSEEIVGTHCMTCSGNSRRETVDQERRSSTCDPPQIDHTSHTCLHKHTHAITSYLPLSTSPLAIISYHFYPAIHSIGRYTKFTAAFFHSLCTVTDFSARALPIGVKFYTAVRPHLRQVFSYFGGIAPGTADFWASTGAMWWDMLLAEALVLFFIIFCTICSIDPEG